MRPLFFRFMNDETGATALEYALIAAGIAMVIVSVVQALGTTTAGKYQDVQNAFQQ